jgi:hypothetical protein
MGNLTKNQQKRAVMQANVDLAKQSTSDYIIFQFNILKTRDISKPLKAIIISRIAEITKEMS